MIALVWYEMTALVIEITHWKKIGQVAEGVSTAAAIVALAQKYNVKLPVLTAVARILEGELTPKNAVLHLMNLPQISTWDP